MFSLVKLDLQCGPTLPVRYGVQCFSRPKRGCPLGIVRLALQSFCTVTEGFPLRGQPLFSPQGLIRLSSRQLCSLSGLNKPAYIVHSCCMTISYTSVLNKAAYSICGNLRTVSHFNLVVDLNGVSNSKRLYYSQSKDPLYMFIVLHIFFAEGITSRCWKLTNLL